MKTKKAIVLPILVLGAMLTAQTVFAADSYKISAKIEHRGAIVGEPVVAAKPGALATVAVHGEKGYTMTVRVVPQEQGLLEVTVKADTPQGSVSSTTTTKAGKPIIVASGEVGLSLTVDESGA